MSRAWLPHTIELEIPTGNMSMTLSVDRWDVNVPPPADAFVKPEQQGFPNVDVSDPRNLPQAAPIAATGQAQGGVQMASTAPANNVAPVSLSRTRYGEPPASMLRRLRLEHAHAMLSATVLSVEEVALLRR